MSTTTRTFRQLVCRLDREEKTNSGDRSRELTVEEGRVDGETTRREQHETSGASEDGTEVRGTVAAACSSTGTSAALGELGRALAGELLREFCERGSAGHLDLVVQVG